MIEEVVDFMIEAGFFDALVVVQTVFCSPPYPPGDAARAIPPTPELLTMGITRNFAVSHVQRWQSEPYGELFMNNAG